MCGIARKVKERIPNCKIIGVDPYGSIMAMPQSLNTVKPHDIEGIGHDFVPRNHDRNVIDEFLKIGNEDTFPMARRLV